MIKFIFKTTATPAVFLNDVQIFATNNSFNVSPLTDGTYTIKIVPASALEILDIYIDDIKLPDYFLWVDEEISANKYYAPTRTINSELAWKFENPIVNWALLIKRARNGEDVNQYIKDRNEYINNIDALLSKIDLLKKKYGV